MASYEDIIMSMGPTVWDSMLDLSLVREHWVTELYPHEPLGQGLTRALLRRPTLAKHTMNWR